MKPLFLVCFILAVSLFAGADELPFGVVRDQVRSDQLLRESIRNYGFVSQADGSRLFEKTGETPYPFNNCDIKIRLNPNGQIYVSLTTVDKKNGNLNAVDFIDFAHNTLDLDIKDVYGVKGDDSPFRNAQRSYYVSFYSRRDSYSTESRQSLIKFYNTNRGKLFGISIQSFYAKDISACFFDM